jgi:molecular chaperone GrpE (heat shock protein)
MGIGSSTSDIKIEHEKTVRTMRDRSDRRKRELIETWQARYDKLDVELNMLKNVAGVCAVVAGITIFGLTRRGGGSSSSSNVNAIKVAAADAKRIAERDVTNARLKGIKAISIDLLKVVDELEHAVNASKEENTASTNTTVRDGISLVQNNFTKVLESHGVTKIDAFEGMQFDPNMHEAVSVTVIDDKKEQTIDTISLVAQEGYMLNEIVLRAPKVNVYKESE